MAISSAWRRGAWPDTSPLGPAHILREERTIGRALARRRRGDDFRFQRGGTCSIMPIEENRREYNVTVDMAGSLAGEIFWPCHGDIKTRPNTWARVGLRAETWLLDRSICSRSFFSTRSHLRVLYRPRLIRNANI